MRSFDKAVIDIASKDQSHSTFDALFQIEIFLNRVADKPSLNVIPVLRSALLPSGLEEEVEDVDSHVWPLGDRDFTLFDEESRLFSEPPKAQML